MRYFRFGIIPAIICHLVSGCSQLTSPEVVTTRTENQWWRYTVPQNTREPWGDGAVATIEPVVKEGASPSVLKSLVFNAIVPIAYLDRESGEVRRANEEFLKRQSGLLFGRLDYDAPLLEELYGKQFLLVVPFESR
jgi:hypothetical protein